MHSPGGGRSCASGARLRVVWPEFPRASTTTFGPAPPAISSSGRWSAAPARLCTVATRRARVVPTATVADEPAWNDPKQVPAPSPLPLLALALRPRARTAARCLPLPLRASSTPPPVPAPPPPARARALAGARSRSPTPRTAGVFGPSRTRAAVRGQPMAASLARLADEGGRRRREAGHGRRRDGRREGPRGGRLAAVRCAATLPVPARPARLGLVTLRFRFRF